jgi:restriction endonuclease Mrr
MPIPESEVLLLPFLRVLGDGAEHKSVEIRERVKAQFDVAPRELLQKTRKGIPVFHNRVELALANLQGAPHGHSRSINKVRKEVYKITEHGMAILKRNPTTLTITDL